MARKPPKTIEDIKCDYYSDIMRIGVSERTVVIDFGRVTPFREEFKYEIRVNMSPEHFVSLVEVMQKYVGQFKEKGK